MVSISPPHARLWLAGMLLLGLALAGAVLEGAFPLAGVILAAGVAMIAAQRTRPAPRPVIGPMKRRASDFIQSSGVVSILRPGGLSEQLRSDLAATEPLLDTLCGQIDGVQQDVADGVMSVVEQVSFINQLSTGQRERIATSLSGMDAMHAAVTAPRTIVTRLSGMLAERDQVISANYAGLQTLSKEFQELRGALDVISQVADKAFFLAINASVEAHRQGAAGLAFGLIASEMRALATQTADGARDVSQSINSFADRMQKQVAAALPDSNSAGRDDVFALVRELEMAQDDVAEISARMGELMQVMEAGHGDIVQSLSDILGRLQFHDVMKQRLGQVSDAMIALKEITACAASGEPAPRSVSDLLDDQQNHYVMESQKIVHAQYGERPGPAISSAPKIELF